MFDRHLSFQGLDALSQWKYIKARRITSRTLRRCLNRVLPVKRTGLNFPFECEQCLCDNMKKKHDKKRGREREKKIPLSCRFCTYAPMVSAMYGAILVAQQPFSDHRKLPITKALKTQYNNRSFQLLHWTAEFIQGVIFRRKSSNQREKREVNIVTSTLYFHWYS